MVGSIDEAIRKPRPYENHAIRHSQCREKFILWRCYRHMPPWLWVKLYFPGHAPLLSPLKPGSIKAQYPSGNTCFYISGGILEVQPRIVTVLADSAIRAENLDEAAVLEAQKNAREKLAHSQSQIDYSAALSELAAAAAQIRIIKERKL